MAGTSASLAAGAIGNVEVNDGDDDASDSAETWVDDSEDDEDSNDDDGNDAAPGLLETVVMDPDQDELPDLPTTLELHDTVRETAEPSAVEAPVTPLDPLPSAEEIEAVDVQDVQLNDISAERTAIEPSEIDDQPLDVGDLLGDPASDQATSESAPKIQMLRGESSFELDEDSLQLQPDPITGELRMKVASEDESTPDELMLDGDEGQNDPAEAAGDVAETIEENVTDATLDGDTDEDSSSRRR